MAKIEEIKNTLIEISSSIEYDAKIDKGDLIDKCDWISKELEKLILPDVMQPLIDLHLNEIVVYNDKKPAMIIEDLDNNFVNIQNEKGEIIKKHKSDLVKASINVA